MKVALDRLIRQDGIDEQPVRDGLLHAGHQPPQELGLTRVRVLPQSVRYGELVELLLVVAKAFQLAARLGEIEQQRPCCAGQNDLLTCYRYTPCFRTAETKASTLAGEVSACTMWAGAHM